MSEILSRIKPLRWQGIDSDMAFTAFGAYSVYRLTTGQWLLRRPQCCREKSVVKCASLADGKRRAERHYREVLGRCTEMVTEKKE